MQTRSFERFGGFAAILAAIASVLYAISFIILKSTSLSALFLLLTGLVSTGVVAALYFRLRGVEPGFSLYGLLLGIAGAMGTAVHGGYDLANAINTPAGVPDSVSALPSQIDPRGLMAFGFVGIAILFFSWMTTKSTSLPHLLGYIGYLSGALMVLLYMARLVLLNPANPILLALAVVDGFLTGPLWYLWVGIALLQPVMVHTRTYDGPERRGIERRHAIP